MRFERRLNTISEVMERLVMLRLHLQSSSNFNPLQSAYRVGYSTETNVVKMLDSFYSAVDDKKLITLSSLNSFRHNQPCMILY